MHKYSYNRSARLGILIQQLTGVIGLIVSIGIAILLFWGMGTVEAPATPNVLQNPQVTLLCAGIWALGVGWTVSIALINATPTVWAGEDGIAISSFVIFRIFIPWSDIVGVKDIRFSHYLVMTKRITFFHRIYGWIYSRSFYPGFVIRRDITEQARLISEIKQHIRIEG